jgi:hypothetical protein
MCVLLYYIFYYLGGGGLTVTPSTQTTAGATVDPLSLARALQIAPAVMLETEFFWLGALISINLHNAEQKISLSSCLAKVGH